MFLQGRESLAFVCVGSVLGDLAAQLVELRVEVGCFGGKIHAYLEETKAVSLFTLSYLSSIATRKVTTRWVTDAGTVNVWCRVFQWDFADNAVLQCIGRP